MTEEKGNVYIDLHIEDKYWMTLRFTREDMTLFEEGAERLHIGTDEFLNYCVFRGIQASYEELAMKFLQEAKRLEESRQKYLENVIEQKEEEE